MFKKYLLIAVLFVLIGFIPFKSEALSLATRFSGAILLQVESHGEAWYVYPVNLKRYYLKDGNAAYDIMRQFGVGITNADLDKLKNNLTEAKKQSGKIFLQVESHGEAYYINHDGRLYYLRDGAAAYSVMRQLGQGITTKDLSSIPVGDNSSTNTPSDNWSSYEDKKVMVGATSFAIKMVTIDLATPGLQIVTDTGNNEDCIKDCNVKPLADYVQANSGFAAIHGSYFCPSDYADCAAKKGSYYFPVYNSRLSKMINGVQLPWPTTGPFLVFGSNNKPYFFLSTQEFKDVATFEKNYNTKIIAALGNKPALIHNGQNIVGTQELDNKQLTTKGYRGGIGIRGNKAYLVIATSATVVDLAGIMQSLGMEQALNLDGGGSSALYYQGAYKVGPGRNLPNAIIFKK